VLVEPLTETVWSDVIDRALGAYGYTFEDVRLRDEVLAELGRTSEAMPLVQFALSELWKKRDAKNRRLTRAGLQAIGGIDGALGRHADATLARLREDSTIPEAAPRALLLGLTTARGTRATRTRAELERLAGPSAWRIIDILEEARLVVRQADSAVLAHDLLIASWASLADWLAQERDQRLLVEDLERAARAWSADPTHAPLWRKQRLEDADQAARRDTAPLSDEAMAFLTASKRDERRRRLFAIGTVAAIVVAATGVTVSYLGAVKAEQAKTAAALDQEQKSSADAKRKTREVLAAQARIDELLKSLADSPKKEEIQQLQEQMRSGEPAPEAARPRRAPVNERRVAVTASASPEPRPATPAPASAPVIKVQSEW
jgi:hypothetical protein